MSERELSNRIEYMICCIGAFAERFSLSNSQAYKYLKRFDGLDFLDQHYHIEHTFSIDDAVDDLAVICNRNGGTLIEIIPWFQCINRFH